MTRLPHFQDLVNRHIYLNFCRMILASCHHDNVDAFYAHQQVKHSSLYTEWKKEQSSECLSEKAVKVNKEIFIRAL